ncbi:MAG: polysaccharide biosynthesis tyrosine autokinase [bacterium]|nr:polysaccharide biosynthesis tyrosine autokinase [bacterium]
MLPIPAPNEELREYWNVLVRRRWAVYLTVALFGLVALVGSFLSTPQYRSSTTLQIERHNPEILTFRDLGMTDSNWAAYSDFYQTQYKIISSRSVARRAVEHLQLASHPDLAPGSSKPGLLQRIRSLIPSRTAPVEQDPEDVLAGWLLGKLEVEPVRNSHLVRISWTSTDPELAARVANGIAGAYVAHSMDSLYVTTDHAEEFLLDQIGELKREIARHEERLQDYGESRRIISIDDTNNLTLQALQDFASRRTAAQATLARADAAYKAALESPAEALPEVARSELIAGLRREYAAYEAEQSETSRTFGENWPGLQTLESKLEQARERLRMETERTAHEVVAAAHAEFLRARDEVDNLEHLLNQQETAAQKLKRDAVEYASLQSEVDKKRETLTALIQRHNEMSLSTRLRDVDSSTNIRVVDEARAPAGHFRPRTRWNVFIALTLGLMAGIGLAVALDYLDNSIGSAEHLSRVVDLPNLAVIPEHGSASGGISRVRRRETLALTSSIDLIAHTDGRTPAGEAYRELRTSILLFTPDGAPRRIMITSAMPEEGKTATAINLAVVLSQLGRRVVTIDTDLRRPRLHAPFDIDNSRGVSTVLAGLERDPGRLVVRTQVPGLDVLPSGPVPPNPSELLNSPRFDAMVRDLLELGYDHVVLDSPPALSVSDPVVLASKVDIGVLVVRAGKTPRQSIKAAADKLRQARMQHLGTILNGVDAGGPDAYMRHRYYGRSNDELDSESTEKLGRTGGASA